MTLNKVYVSEIAEYLNVKYTGENLIIDHVTGIANLKNNSLSFITKKNYNENTSVSGLVIAIEGYNINEKSQNSYIISKNPRLDFIKVFDKYFKHKSNTKISNSAIIGNNCQIAENVSIGEYCIIKDNVIIGGGTIINNHVVIEKDTVIGNNCYIKSGVIIGEDGFGFERDEKGVPLRFPHIGNVVIGENVEIGANTIIARGTLESTIIHDNVKIDDQVFIAHNVIIGKNTMIVACSEISGSTQIGRNCWIGPNSTIRDGLTIGDNVFLGIDCSVSKNIDDNMKQGSLSDMSLRDIVRFSKLLKGKK